MSAEPGKSAMAFFAAGAAVGAAALCCLSGNLPFDVAKLPVDPQVAAVALAGPVMLVCPAAPWGGIVFLLGAPLLWGTYGALAYRPPRALRRPATALIVVIIHSLGAALTYRVFR